MRTALAPLRRSRAGSAARRRGAAPLVVVAMSAAYAVLFSVLSIARHRAFWTGRFDLGNMIQAVWSTSEGRPLETTSAGGAQFSRLGAHVDPVLVVFTPLYELWSSPEMLLVAQAVIVASGAFPAFWLGRRWLGDARLAAAAAAVYLLYPPTQWATVTEFHPVTLATPILMYAIWAAEERHDVLLAVLGVAALLTKEQVGLAVAALGLWIVVRHRRLVLGMTIAAVSAAWSAVAVLVIIPHHNSGQESPFVARYGGLGDDGGDVVRTLLTRPWEVADAVGSYDRLSYLVALLAPLALLPLAAPLLAACALPEVLINILADYFPQYSIEFQYVAVISPFLVAAAILGLSRLRRLRRPFVLARALRDPRAVAVGMVVWVTLAGVRLGPLPWWSHMPLGSSARAAEYRQTDHSRVMRRAVALVPDGVPVSAGNNLGAHLSERERIYTFPVVADAEWVIVDQHRPFLFDRPSALEHARRVAALRRRSDFRVVLEVDGITVLRRTRPAVRR